MESGIFKRNRIKTKKRKITWKIKKKVLSLWKQN